MTSGYTLGKNERLKRRKVIEQLFKEGKSIAAFPVRVQFMFTTGLIHPVQAGFTANSRYFKRAVDRNRLKRLMREAYRLQKNILVEKVRNEQKQMALFFIYTGRELPAYKEVNEKIAVILKKLTSILNEMAASRT